MIQKIKKLIAYRELLFYLVRRELRVKYKGSMLGFFWSLMNPLAIMLIFTVVFNVFLKISPPKSQTGLMSFPAFLLCGLLPWNFFNNSLSSSVNSFISNGNLIKKVYFPREVIPFSLVFANLVNFFLELIVLFIFLAILGNNFLPLLLPLLFIILIQTILIMGSTLIFSIIDVYFRDMQHLLVILLTFLFYACPIIYAVDFVPNTKNIFGLRLPIAVRTVYKLNPLASLIICYKKILYDCQMPSLILVSYVFVFAIAVLLIGYFVFLRYERFLAEEV